MSSLTGCVTAIAQQVNGDKHRLEWTDHPPPMRHRTMPGVLRDVAGGLVAIGGLDPATPDVALSSVERYLPPPHGTDLWSSKWLSLPRLCQARCCPGAILGSSNGEIYAVGGGESMYRHSRVYATVEKL